MRLRNIILLYRVRLRARLAHELFAILGIAVGVALLFASQIVRASPDSSMRQLVSGVIGTMRFQLAARSPEGFDQGLLGAVQRLPGVWDTIPVFEEHADLIGPAGQQPVELLSTDARFAHLGGPLLHRFSAAQLNHQQALALPLELASSVGLASLESAELQVGGRSVRVFIGAVLFESGLGVLAHSRVAFAPIAYAQQLSQLPGRLTNIFVRPRGGHERQVHAELERLAAGRLNVQPADFGATLFNQAAAPSNQSAELFSVIGALVGFLFALNALMLTASQRRNLVEDLRLDGYSRRMIVEVLLFDALVLGVLASLVGLVLGDLLSAALFRSSPGYLSFAFPIDAQRIVSWQSVVLAVCGGLLAAFAGVLISLRRAILSRRLLGAAPARASARSGLRVMLGELVCWTIIAITLLAAPGAAIVGIVSLVIALLLALPWLLGACMRVADRVQRSLSSTAAHLAVIELRSTANWSRTLAIAATGATAVFGSVAVEGAQSNLQRGLDRTAHDLAAPAGVWVTAAGTQNVLATTAFPASQAGRLARLPDVRSVGLFRAGFLDDGVRRVWVMAPPASAERPIPPSQMVSGDLAQATARLRRGGWAVVSQALAAEHRLRIGQRFTLPAPRPIVLRVAALSTNIGWPPGAIVISANDYVRAWPGEGVSAYGITLRAGVSPAEGRREVQRALGAAGAGLTVETRSEREQRLRAASRQGLSRLTQITDLVLIAAILAMTTAMGAMIWQRRPLLADMKVDGFDKGVLWRSLLIESVLLLGVGCSIGALFGLCGQLLLSHTLAVVTGFPVVASIGALVAIGSLLAVTCVAVAIVAVPGYLAVRVRAAIVLQD
ncbi:MAG TPA: FtsX-like permease family protein [Solirubrobacteraceae bacterium]|jgi:putative ABC transport system permease protein|nr:FtsX-like permease family protein [Solirubrobacteraceae bacterium]